MTNLKNTLGKILMGASALVLLGGCESKPRMAMSMNGDSVEIHVPAILGANWMRIYKKNGTKITFYDMNGFSNGYASSIDRMRIQKPGQPSKVYCKNELNDSIFASAKDYWNNFAKTYDSTKNANVVKSIKGDYAK